MGGTRVEEAKEMSGQEMEGKGREAGEGGWEVMAMGEGGDRTAGESYWRPHHLAPGGCVPSIAPLACTSSWLRELHLNR